MNQIKYLNGKKVWVHVETQTLMECNIYNHSDEQ